MPDFLMPADADRLMQLQAQQPLTFENIINLAYSTFVKPGDIVIDAGANVGLHTFPLAKLVSAAGQVHAIEALPHLAENLIKSAADQSLSQITIHNTAIADKVGEATFNWVKNDTGYSGLRQRDTYPPGFKESIEQTTVPVSTLDALFPTLPHVKFIKFDIEGGEFHALQGGQKLLAAHHPLMIMEYSTVMATIYEHSEETFLSFMDALDYEIFDLFGRSYRQTRAAGLALPWYVIAACRSNPAHLQLVELVNQGLKESLSSLKS